MLNTELFSDVHGCGIGRLKKIKTERSSHNASPRVRAFTGAGGEGHLLKLCGSILDAFRERTYHRHPWSGPPGGGEKVPVVVCRGASVKRF